MRKYFLRAFSRFLIAIAQSSFHHGGLIFEHLGLVFRIISSQIFCRILIKSEAISFMVSLFLFNLNFDEHRVLNLSQSAFPSFQFGTPEDLVVLYLTLSLMTIGK